MPPKPSIRLVQLTKLDTIWSLAPLIEIAILIGAGYLSIFEWIKKKDIKSNEKNDFFVPAAFLVVGIILAFTIGVVWRGRILSICLDDLWYSSRAIGDLPGDDRNGSGSA